MMCIPKAFGAAVLALGSWLLLATVGCSREEAVTSPVGVSARWVSEAVQLGRETFRNVSITAKLPPNSEFHQFDFTMAYQKQGQKSYANCCTGISMEGHLVPVDKLDKFSTVAKTAGVEFVFLAPPDVKEVTLIYKGAPAGKALAVGR